MSLYPNHLPHCNPLVYNTQLSRVNTAENTTCVWEFYSFVFCTINSNILDNLLFIICIFIFNKHLAVFWKKNDEDPAIFTRPQMFTAFLWFLSKNRMCHLALAAPSREKCCSIKTEDCKNWPCGLWVSWAEDCHVMATRETRHLSLLHLNHIWKQLHTVYS